MSESCLVPRCQRDATEGTSRYGPDYCRAHWDAMQPDDRAALALRPDDPVLHSNAVIQ